MKNYSYCKWRIWTILAFSFVMSLFHRGALGTLSQDISTELGLTASQLSNLVSITFSVYALMQIPSGILIDLFGFRKISSLGMLCTGIGSILLGLSNNLTLALGGRFLIGMGTSVIFISILKMQQTWFSKDDFTKASGFLSFIGNMGGIFATFPLALLAIATGWRGAMFLMGGICIIIAALIILYTKNSPIEYGFELPTGNASSSASPKISIFNNLLVVFRQKALWRNFFVLFTLVGCTTTLTGLWGINYISSVYNLETTQASFYVAFVIYGFVAGALSINAISNYFKDNLMLYPRICCILMSVCWGYILFVADGKPPLTILILLFFVMGFLATAHIISFTDIVNQSTPNTSGLATSVVNSGEFIGSSLISIIIGSTLDFSWGGTLIDGVRYYEPSSYTLAFFVFFIVSVLGIFTSFIGTKAPLPASASTPIKTS